MEHPRGRRRWRPGLRRGGPAPPGAGGGAPPDRPAPPPTPPPPPAPAPPPLIAHTANDIVTTFTGLYGDRHALGVGANSYNAYNADGTTDHAGSFAYWTDPIFDETTPPNPGHDTTPSMVYSATPPATTNPPPAPNKITPAPRVPFTRAGCKLGDVSIATADLE